MKEIKVQGFDEFMSAVVSPDIKDKIIICLFTGDKDENGKSWCPDCVTSEPIVRKSLELIKDDDSFVFVYCSVGGRAFWKDKSNPFRTNDKLKLNGVPTLMKWGFPNEKLVEDQISADVIPILFE
uniref:Thioredoxin domain-containing protein 17 n=1 Tax=Ciona intestinalis TaxID=7719 RepID=H2XSJ3_CIOIN|nr:thioredoxin domain-containing protein 17-like [Ciona intestinalis]|eukprot:XP_026695959.1 thioredoxin domain-containing protein 17-like [Ciona intestinalis]